ncbi:unnamed protein product [Cunninghamella blakesleeana]
MKDYWKITTKERELTKKLIERKNAIKSQFKLKADELFFILEDNGALLKSIEKDHHIKITINVHDLQCTVEGPKKDIEKSTQIVRDAIALERQTVQLIDKDNQPSFIFTQIPHNTLNDLSKTTETYITVDDNKISLAAKSNATLENAKRKLSIFLQESGLTSKKPLQSANSTFIEETSSLSLMPLHDSVSMPSNMKSLGWSRICNNNKGCSHDAENGPLFFSLDDRTTYKDNSDLVPSSHIKKLLESNFIEEENKRISMEARFGQLLFQNHHLQTRFINLLVPDLSGNFGINELKEYFQKTKTSKQFFSGNPPHKMRSKLRPLPLNEGYHRRIIKLDYIDSSLLCQLKDVNQNISSSSSSSHSPISRLQLEYIENDDGILEFKNIIGEHKRYTVDLLQIYENIDVRLIAKQYSLFDNPSLESNSNHLDDDVLQSMRNLTKSCQLLGHSELDCPPHWKLGDNDMTLMNVTFNNQSRYQLKNNVVTLQYTEEQEDKSHRSEMIVTSLEDDKELKNEFNSWDEIWENVWNLSRDWKYR